MEGLPKDLLMETALNLSPPDLISLCATNKKQNDALCNSEIFWRRKLEKDYPEEFLEFYETGRTIQNPKDIYIRRFTFVSRKIEKFVEELIRLLFHNNNYFSDFIKPEYGKSLYKEIYNIYKNFKDKELDEEDIDDLILENIEEVYLPGTLQENVVSDMYPKIRDFIADLTFLDGVHQANRKDAIKLKKK